MDRYFVGKFKKKIKEVTDLTELNNSFVLFEMPEGEDTLTAIFSNTDVSKGEKWDYQEDIKPATKKFKARSRKKK